MTDEVIRLLIVVGVLVVAGLVAVLINAVRKPPHPTLVAQPDGDRPGVVLFTSLDCSTCKKTIALLRNQGIAFREITHELEPQRFEAWQVLAVPLTVILDASGEIVDAIAGTPTSRRLARSARAGGIEVSR